MNWRNNIEAHGTHRQKVGGSKRRRKDWVYVPMGMGV